MGNQSKADSLYKEILRISLLQLDVITPFLDEMGVMNYYSTSMGPISYIYENALNNTNLTEIEINELAEFNLNYKGFGLLKSKEKFHSETRPDSIVQLITERELLKQKYTYLFRQNKYQEIPNIKNRIKILNSEIDSSSSPKISLTQSLSQVLNKGEVAIDIVYYEQGSFNFSKISPGMYGAFIIRPNQKIDFIKLCPDSAMSAVFDEFATLKDVWGSTFVNNPKANNLIKKTILQPLQPYISDAHTIYFSPAGRLNMIPYEGLLLNDSTYFVEKYNFHILSNLNSVPKIKESLTTSIDNLVLFGGADYETENYVPSEYPKQDLKKGEPIWYPLIDAQREIESIYQLAKSMKIPTLLFKNSVSTELNFINQAIDSKKKILHFSDHAFWLPTQQKKQSSIYFQQLDITFFENPFIRSGLAFEKANSTWKNGISINNANDDILTALEILGYNFQNIPLLVLSACETGSGIAHTNEGVFGLERALQLAGVEKLILSRWAVRAKPTRILMERFYKNLLQNKLPVHQALREAKLSMIKDKYSPHDWAGFVLIQ